MQFESLLIEKTRQKIREEGFMTAIEIVTYLITLDEDLVIESHVNLLNRLSCNDIHIIAYANLASKDYRRKDLYYFNPDPEEGNNV